MIRARRFRTTEMQDFIRSCKAPGVLVFIIQLIVAQLGNILGVIGLQHETDGHNVVVCITTIRVGRCIVPICYSNLLRNGCVNQACSGPFHGNQLAFHLVIVLHQSHAALTNLDVLVLCTDRKYSRALIERTAVVRRSSIPFEIPSMIVRGAKPSFSVLAVS